ncbi:MAG: phasin family protein [Paracoccaceae bacterium]
MMPAHKPTIESPVDPAKPALVGLDASMAVNTAAVQAWMDMANETVRFVWDRLQQDIEAQKAMVACKSVEEMLKIQAEYLTVAQEQYTTAAGRMLDLMGSATSAGLTDSKARRFDDVPV